MENDDFQVGRILSRREVLAVLGGAGGAALLGGSARASGASDVPFRLPACIVRPSQTEGPYFLDATLERSDIRADPTDGSVREGTPVALTFQVSRIGPAACQPLPGALVDVWQCDAMGVYSGVRDANGFFDTTGQRFLRGHQITDPEGRARFSTIYPGWYQGRTVHAHFKIRTNPSGDDGHEFTSQLYFDDGLTDRVFEGSPYAEHAGRRTHNEEDGIFRGGGGQLLLDAVPEGEGYSAVFDVGLQIG